MMQFTFLKSKICIKALQKMYSECVFENQNIDLTYYNAIQISVPNS